MALSSDPASEPVHDVLGVGFGPSNMALSIALAEETGSGLSSIFLERKPTFGWHQGLLLKQATMQVSFLKDLATMRNPVSQFTFLNYLHDRGRLADFINRRDFYPSRIEFHDYLAWAAAQLASSVRYGTEVQAIAPVREGADIVAFDVHAYRGDGREHRYRARNLVLGMGLVPRLPLGAVPSAQVWHSSELLERIGTNTIAVRRIAVVGGGQSAGEVTAHLHDQFPDAEVFAVVPRYGFAPADDSAFVNGVFDPQAVTEFYDSPPEVKAKFYEYHSNTNYSAVDLDLIRELHRRVYHETVTGMRRLHILRMTRVRSMDVGPATVQLGLDALLPGAPNRIEVDIVVFATGYEPMNPAPLLGDLAQLCEQDDAGRFTARRDYRLATAPHLKAGLYVQGGTEHSHGLSSSLLSNTAVRAGEIARSLMWPGRTQPGQGRDSLESREYVRT